MSTYAKETQDQTVYCLGVRMITLTKKRRTLSCTMLGTGNARLNYAAWASK